MSVIEILKKMKEQLHARGAKTFRSLARVFRNFDSFDGNHKIDSQEFYSGLKEIQVDVTEDEAAVLMQFFDKDNDGCVNLTEFLVGIRGTLNAKRQAAVDQAFLKFDKTCDGVIDAADLAEAYNVDKHPKYISGEMTKDEIFMEFLQNFNDKNGDGKITREEFNEYYAAVSADIDRDDYFVLMMRQAWKLDE